MYFSFISILSLLLLISGGDDAVKDTVNTKDSRNFEFTYRVSLQGIPKTAKELDIWMPLPQSDDFQEIMEINIESPVPYSIEREPKFNNEFLFIHIVKDIPNNLEITVNIKAHRNIRNGGAWVDQPGDNLKKYLEPDDLVPIDGQIAEEAREVTNGIEVDIQKVRAIYDHIVKTVSYDKSGTGWGRGDALYACSERRGNCTDFHSLFLGMCRSVGIPARFVIGFPLPTDREKLNEIEIPGYHCWAEFYIEGVGWLPIDASEAFKHPDKKEFFFGNLDANRIQFTVGRDIQLQTKASAPTLNYFIYPYCILDGNPYFEVKSSFYFKDILP